MKPWKKTEESEPKTTETNRTLENEPRIRAKISRVAVVLTEADPALEIVFWRVQQIPKRPRIR